MPASYPTGVLQVLTHPWWKAVSLACRLRGGLRQRLAGACWTILGVGSGVMYAEGMCLGPGQHLLSVWLTESEGVFALLSSLTHLFLTTPTPQRRRSCFIITTVTGDRVTVLQARDHVAFLFHFL